MTENNDKLVLGLTGSFGSGCSTLAEAIQRISESERARLKHGIFEVF
jgi:pantothenate kinase-related protein Tda10